MSGGEIAQLITSIATLVGVVGTLAIGWRNAGKIDDVHTLANGLTAKLVASTATASLAKGNLEGRSELKAEQADVPR